MTDSSNIVTASNDVNHMNILPGSTNNNISNAIPNTISTKTGLANSKKGRGSLTSADQHPHSQPNNDIIQGSFYSTHQPAIGSAGLLDIYDSQKNTEAVQDSPELTQVHVIPDPATSSQGIEPIKTIEPGITNSDKPAIKSSNPKSSKRNTLTQNLNLSNIGDRILFNALAGARETLEEVKPLPKNMKIVSDEGIDKINRSISQIKRSSTIIDSINITKSQLKLAKKAELFEEKISISNAKWCTKLNKIRNRWHDREASGEFSTLYDLSNTIENPQHYGEIIDRIEKQIENGSISKWYGNLYILIRVKLVNQSLILIIPISMCVVSLILSSVFGGVRFNKERNAINIFNLVMYNIVNGFMIMMWWIGVYLGYDFSKNNGGSRITDDNDEDDTSNNTILYDIFHMWNPKSRFYYPFWMFILRTYLPIVTYLLVFEVIDKRTLMIYLIAVAGWPLSRPYLSISRFYLESEKTNTKSFSHPYAMFPGSTDNYCISKNWCSFTIWKFHLKHFRATFSIITASLLMTFNTFSFVSWYLILDVKIFNSSTASTTLQNSRGIVFNFYKFLLQITVYYVTTTLNSPFMRLHMASIIGMINGMVVALAVSQSPSWNSFLGLVITDWIGFFFRVFTVLPLWEKNCLIRGIRKWIMYYKIEPPLGMPIRSFHMANARNELIALAIGCFSIGCTLPIAIILDYFAPPEFREVTNSTDTNGIITTTERTPWSERLLAIPLRWFFPLGATSCLFQLLFFIQQIFQIRTMLWLLYTLFGNPKDGSRYTDFSYFTGYWGHWRTRQTIITWSCLIPYIASIIAIQGRGAALEGDGFFAED